MPCQVVCYMRKVLEEKEKVLLVDPRNRRYLVTLKKDGRFHSTSGFISHNQIMGQEEGVILKSSLRIPFLVVRPTLADYILKMPRGAQVVYPKDIGIILLWADIYPGATVLEAGMGSGALTMALLRAVGDKGKVISYELRPDFAQRALTNIRDYLGTIDNLIVRSKDIYEEIDEEPLDRMILDLPEPWRVVESAARTLRPGGIFVTYTPTIIQTQRVVEALRDQGNFCLIEVLETLLRPWNIEGPSVRPAHRMVAHTAFISIARKKIIPS